MYPSEFMDQFVHDLLERYEADVLPSGLLYLELRRQGHGVLIIEEKVKHQQMHVRYQLYDARGKPVPEPEVVFHIASDGHWVPFALYRISAGQQTFADLDVGRGELIITDPKNQASLAYFADYWAEALRTQGWLKFATKYPAGLPKPNSALEALIQEVTQPPDRETLRHWLDDCRLVPATDGCMVEMDATCEHGCRSWVLELGLLYEAKADLL